MTHFQFSHLVLELQVEPTAWVKVTVNIDEYRFMANEAFKMHFRMSRDVFEVSFWYSKQIVSLYIAFGLNLIECFQNLIAAVGRELNHENHVDPDYELSHILLMVLWVLATPDTFRSVALRFGETPEVLHFHYLRVINILSQMADTYIYWPHAEERTVVSRAVQRRTGFPGVVGAVDGCHIQIATPREQPDRYFNRHRDHSIVLQGVADETLLFRDVYIGEPGSTHDSRVFRRSPLCVELLENMHIYLDDDQHILGDGAYVLTNRVSLCQVSHLLKLIAQIC